MQEFESRLQLETDPDWQIRSEYEMPWMTIVWALLGVFCFKDLHFNRMSHELQILWIYPLSWFFVGFAMCLGLYFLVQDTEFN